MTRRVPTKREKPKRKTVHGTEYRKACRCKGRSTGKFIPPADWKEPIPIIPVAFGIMMGLPIKMTCDKCGKEWIGTPAKRRRVR